MADEQAPVAAVSAPAPAPSTDETIAMPSEEPAPAVPAAIATAPAPVPTPTPTPSSAGFKLKLKLGGGNSSTTVTPSTGSIANPTTHLASSSHAEGSTSQGSIAAANNNDTSSAAEFPNSTVEDAEMAVEDANESSAGGGAFGEQEAVAGPSTLTPTAAASTSSTKKAGAIKTPRSRKTSSTTGRGKSGAATPTAAVKDEDTSMHGISSPGTTTTTGAAAAEGTATASSNSGKAAGETAKYETSIGSIVLPVGSSSSGTGRKKPRQPTGEAGTGLGRGWRKGLKGYQKGDNLTGAGRGDGALSLGTGSQSPSGSSGAPGSATATTTKKRKSQAASAGANPATAAAASTSAATTSSTLVEDIAPEQIADSEEYVPPMAAAGGLVTTEKWAKGLPGGNEQSRLTASMASAVNKQFPVGPPPKTGSSFLYPQPLDKNTPQPRSWKKIKREIIGPSGIPFSVTVWQGDNESQLADYLVEHPRPVPVDKKAQAAGGLAGLDVGSPAPEGSYPPSEGGTPADGASDATGTGAGGHSGATSTRGVGRGRGRAGGAGAKVAGPRRKPGPPKKIKPAPPPIAGAETLAPLPGSLSSSMVPNASTGAASSNTSNPGTPDVPPQLEAVMQEASSAVTEIAEPQVESEEKETASTLPLPLPKLEEPSTELSAAPEVFEAPADSGADAKMVESTQEEETADAMAVDVA